MSKIVVETNGEKVTWEDGKLSGKQGLIDKIEFASLVKAPTIFIYGTPAVEASLDDKENIIAIAAALVQANSYDAVIIEAPEKFYEYLESFNSDEEGVIY